MWKYLQTLLLIGEKSICSQLPFLWGKQRQKSNVCECLKYLWRHAEEKTPAVSVKKSWEAGTSVAKSTSISFVTNKGLSEEER